jgi:S-methylmethionine-dependent homocysteine/selenocysteine methylase
MDSLTLLDGGNAQEIWHRSGENPAALWSLSSLFTDPDLVRQVHLDFLRAGCRVLTLHNYAATPSRLWRDRDELPRFLPGGPAGNPAEALTTIHQQAARLAAEAREAAYAEGTAPVGSVRLAGCLPPLVASYHAEVIPPEEEAVREYRQLVSVQSEAVDLFLAETLSSLREIRAVLAATREVDLPLWIALTVDDEVPAQLRSGESLAEVVSSVPRAEGPDAWLLNCSTPEAITAALPELRTGGRPFGAYANGFVSVTELAPGGTVDSLQRRPEASPERYADWAEEWARQGATVIGGCCETGPDHLRAAADRLRQADFLAPA